MSSTNKTAELHLSQFIGTDIPSILTDYNGDMQKIDAGVREVKQATAGAVSDLSSVTARVTNAEQDISGLNSTVQGIATRVVGAEGDIDGIQALIPVSASAQNKLITAQELPEIPSIEGLEENVEQLQTDVAGVQSNLHTVSNDVTRINNRINNIVTAKPFYYQPAYDSTDTLLTRLVKCFEAVVDEYPSFWNIQKLYQLFGNIVIRVGTSFFHVMDTPSNFDYIKLDCNKFAFTSAGVLDELNIGLGLVSGTAHMPTSATIKELTINGGAQAPTDVTADYNEVNVAIYVNALPYNEE